jgi:8-oxo-dGTP diphosphatase
MPISPYLARLRARIGHDLITLPGVSACIFDELECVLPRPSRGLGDLDSARWSSGAG